MVRLLYNRMSLSAFSFGKHRVTQKTVFMLPLSWSCTSYRITITNTNNHFANRNQTNLYFQPRFGNIDIIGRNPRWLHNDKGQCSYSTSGKKIKLAPSLGVQKPNPKPRYHVVLVTDVRSSTWFITNCTLCT